MDFFIFDVFSSVNYRIPTINHVFCRALSHPWTKEIHWTSHENKTRMFHAYLLTPVPNTFLTTTYHTFCHLRQKKLNSFPISTHIQYTPLTDTFCFYNFFNLTFLFSLPYLSSFYFIPKREFLMHFSCTPQSHLSYYHMFYYDYYFYTQFYAVLVYNSVNKMWNVKEENGIAVLLHRRMMMMTPVADCLEYLSK